MSDDLDRIYEKWKEMWEFGKIQSTFDSTMYMKYNSMSRLNEIIIVTDVFGFIQIRNIVSRSASTKILDSVEIYNLVSMTRCIASITKQMMKENECCLLPGCLGV